MTKLIGAGRDYAQRLKKSAFFNTWCIYVICMDLSTNSYYFPVQH